MDIVNNLIWYFDDPEDAKIRNTHQLISSKQLDTIVFDNSLKDNVVISLPLNEHFLFSETRELQRPVTVRELLELIRNFYDEPLEQKNINKAFKNNMKWKKEVINEYDGDLSKIKKYDVFVNINCAPDFCGLNLDENTGEYSVLIGPE